jgi:hypothetical protein
MTASGYVTDVAYVPGFYPQMAPVTLRHVAALNGVCPPASGPGFRYLELGCGLGRSLTTLAAANPRGEFIGVLQDLVNCAWHRHHLGNFPLQSMLEGRGCNDRLINH